MDGECFYRLPEYKNEQKSTAGGNWLESTNVEDLSVPLEHMSTNSFNFWLYKFICELEKQTGQRYRLLSYWTYRHLGNAQG